MSPRKLVSARACAVAAALGVTMAGAFTAGAGGLQLPTRGVEPTGRGGAVVAGIGDLHAMWFNPAGLARLAGDGHSEYLVDASYVQQSVDYTRIDSGMNPQPKVQNDAPGMPIPTLGLGFDLGKRATLAAGILVPYAALGRYPEDGAQRYSLVDLSETVLFIAEVAVGYRVSDTLRVGAGIQNMVFKMASLNVFSGCPGQTVCAPEDPELDALGKVEQLSPFIPSGVIGAQIDLGARLRAGASFQLPFFVRGSGSFTSRLPSSGFFDGASIVGDRADVSFNLPPILRAGVEYDVTPTWKAELDATIEFWSIHDEFSIVPVDVRIENAAGVGTYELGSLSIPRHYQNSYSANLGVEGRLSPTSPLRLRGGYAFETAAAPDAYLSVLTVDANKHLLAAGLSYQMGKLSLDAVVGYVLMASRTVDPDVGKAPQLTPLRYDPPLDTYVNWGDYSSSWLLAGLGVSGTL